MNRLWTLLPLADAALCAVLLLLLLVDEIWPSLDLFLGGFVKGFTLIVCLISAICGAMLYARRRRSARQRPQYRRYGR